MGASVEDSIRLGDVVRTRSIRSPAMLVINLHIGTDDKIFAELLWFDANMNARQLNLDTDLLEHIPEHQ
jgi:hypothetical protein